MRMPPTIADYYRHALEAMKQEVEGTADADVLGRDPDEWRTYLIDRWGMEVLELDTAREEQLVEQQTERQLRGYDIYTDRPAGTRYVTDDVRLEVPVTPSDTLKVIAEQHLATTSYSLTREYPPFHYDHRRGIVSVVAEAKSEVVKRERDELHRTLRTYNDNITEQNRQFPEQVARAIAQKRERVASKNKGLDDLSAQVGLKVVKKADVSTAVLGLIRIGGHLPYGGYDAQTDGRHTDATCPSPVH